MPHALVPASYLFLLDGPPGREQVLLHRRQNTGYLDGYWASPAGHLEIGESPAECAVREAYEEAGIRVKVEDLRPLTVMHRSIPDGGPLEQRVDFMFVARTWSGEPTVREPHKNAGLGWWPLAGLPKPLVPHEREVLEALASGSTVPPISSRRLDRPR